MRAFTALLKSLFLNSVRSGGKKLSQNGLFGMVLSSAIFAVLYVIMTALLGPYFSQVGLEAEFLAILMFASQVLVLLMGSVLLINIMFFSKDAELLLSLPVKTTQLFLAKLCYVYISELVFTAFLMLSAGITFGIIAGFSAASFLLLLVATFLIPVLPLVLAAIISLPAMLLMSLFKGKGFITTLFFLAAFGTLMYFYTSFFGSMGMSSGADPSIELDVSALKAVFAHMYPNISLSRIIVLSSANTLADVLITLGINGGLLAAASLLALFSFRRGMRAQLEEGRAKSDAKVEFKQTSAFKAFVLKELREILRNPGLAFYCLFSVVIAPVMIMFYGNTMTMVSAEESAGMDPSLMGTTMGFFLVTLLVCSMNYTALSSVSREGKNFNMSRTLPAPYAFQMQAKIRVADLVLALGVIVSSVALLLIGADILQTVAFTGFALILGNAINYILSLRDAKKPTLEWESITVMLKNNKAALIAMGIAFMFALPLLLALIFISFMPAGWLQTLLFVLMWFVLYGAAILLNYYARKKMHQNVETYIAKVE